MAVARNNPQQTNSTTGSTTYTLASYAVPSGTDRVLVVVAHLQRSSDTTYTASCTFNGGAMTEAVTQYQGGSSRGWRSYIWYLIAPAVTTANIVVTSSATLQGAIVSAVTLTDAHQSSVLGATDADVTSPINSLGLAGTVSGSMIIAAVTSHSGASPTWTWTTATEDYDLNNGADSAEVAGSAAYYSVPSGGSVTITAERSATIAQAGVAAEFLPASVGGVNRASKRLLRQGAQRGLRAGF